MSASKYKVVLPFADIIPRMTWLVGITTQAVCAEQSGAVAQADRDPHRGVDYIYKNRDEAMQIYAKIWQQDPKQVATYFPKYFGYEGEWTHGEFEKLGLDKMSEGLQLVGDVEKPVDWKAIDRSAIPAKRTAKAALIVAAASMKGKCAA